MSSLPPVETARSSKVSHRSYQRPEQGYVTSTNSPTPFATADQIIADRNSIAGNAADMSPASQTASYQSHSRFNEEWDASQRGSSIVDGERSNTNHAPSAMSQGDQSLSRRGGTLKKKSSLKRSSSRRSSRAGSVRSLALQPEPSDEMHSAFYSPVPTTGNPTELLANRFTAWRKFLKDLISYFREVQNSYDQRGKSILKLSNVANNISAPSNFLQTGGINDAMQILRDYHKQSVLEANKARMIEEDVIQALTGLRSDLQQKIKEIKNLSGDFKNSVDKEMDATKRAVRLLGDALGQSDIDASQMTGKQDPYLLRLAVDRQLERQIDEENYLHQAYLNLETSGRELEAIVVGEIQKAYNAYTGILKREADETYDAIENLRTGPIAMPKDYEWNSFIEPDENFVDPRIPVRRVESIYYPGRDHDLAQEVRAGLLERKSKYLKSYTAGWYVLSPTHLHEFKTADKSQAPIMSLYLPEQKLGSHSAEGGSSNKFMLKGRQTGSMHRGHSWVFRAESYDTMMAWYDDIRSLTESAPQERDAFVRSHARSFSAASQRAASVSSDGVMDEEDDEPFSTAATSAMVQTVNKPENVKRPEPGGRFPSDIQVDPARGLQIPLSPSSANSSVGNIEDQNAIAGSVGLPGSEYYPEQHTESHGSPLYGHYKANETKPVQATQLHQYAEEDGFNPYTYQPMESHDLYDKRMLSTTGKVTLAAEWSEGQIYPTSAAQVDSVRPTSNFGREHQAMEESGTVAAPDLDDQSSYGRLAEQEAAMVAVDDAGLIPDQNFDCPANSTKVETNTSSLLVSTLHPPAGSNTVTDADRISHPVSNTLTTFEKPIEQHIEYSASQSLEPATGSLNAVHTNHFSLESLRSGHINDASSSSTQMHIPGEFPLPTPIEEHSSFST